MPGTWGKLLLLHGPAEYCKYGMLKEPLIRDRTVAGIRDANLKAPLQLRS